METDAEQLYADRIRRLPPKERLQLAALILEDLANGTEFDDTWSEEDFRDLAAFSLSVAPAHETDKKTR
jgi:hypothetical protein